MSHPHLAGWVARWVGGPIYQIPGEPAVHWKCWATSQETDSLASAS